MSITVTRYTSSKAHEWDSFVKESKNGTFLFMRGYMDYHSDRFHDHSLMYHNDKGRLVAVMPANEVGDTLYSHQGLTYGGLILGRRVHTEELGEMFSITMEYLRTRGFHEWYYKAVPSIYHTLPSEDDEYWLWKNGAQLVDCSLMTAIPIQSDNNLLSSSKRNNSNRLMREGYVIDMEAPLSDFWPILTSNLQERFSATPVHSYEEIMLLQSRFPDHIRCCTINTPEGTPLAGTVLYYSDNVVKAQYTSASHEGKHHKVIDYLFTYILHQLRRKTNLLYLDFGTSMLTDSTDLNIGLVSQKEGFGGRGIACKIFRIEITPHCQDD